MRGLLAYDASAGAEQAAALVVSLPWPSGSAVRVVAVVEPTAAMVSAIPFSFGRVVTSAEIDTQIFDHLQSQVALVVERLRAAGVAAEGVVLRGRPASVLVDEARAFAADLVVAGSRGHGPIASLVLGSVSAELVDHVPSPVLVAKRPEAKRILLGSDGSPAASRAEEVVAAWPIFADAPVHVVSVAEVVRPWTIGIAPTMYAQVSELYGQDLDAAKAEHERLADDVVDRLHGAGRVADAKLRVGDAAAELIEEAAAWNADLIVVGSRGITGLSRLLLGSVARNVLHASPTSVLVVRDASG
jgi:nucleotide-binding universal stress UspA family protein